MQYLSQLCTWSKKHFFLQRNLQFGHKDYQTKPHLVEKFKSSNKGKANVTFNVTVAASLEMNRTKLTKNTVTCLIGQINKIKDSQFINMSSVQKDSFTVLI